MTRIYKPNGNAHIATDRDMEPLAASTIHIRIPSAYDAKRKVIYNQAAGSDIRQEKMGMSGGIKLMKMVSLLCSYKPKTTGGRNKKKRLRSASPRTSTNQFYAIGKYSEPHTRTTRATPNDNR